MNFSFPILASVLVFLCWRINAVACAQDAEPKHPFPDGHRLVVRSARQLFEQPPLEANLRQKIDVFGHELSGPGTYAQLGRGTGKARLELKLSVGGQVASLQQICDGRFLYVRQIIPPRSTLTFVDFERVRQATQTPEAPMSMGPPVQWLSHGGLPGLLWQLSENFQFGPASAQEIGDGKVPVWVTRGTWKAEQLTRLLPRHREDILAGRPVQLEELPAHVPHSVTLTLGRDEVFPLFPYRIVYLRHEAARDGQHETSLGTILRPILTLEFFQVRDQPDMNPHEFTYQPDDQEVVDATEELLKKYGLIDATP